MTHAVVQPSAVELDLPTLANAFTASGVMAAHDAVAIANHRSGVFAGGLTAERAEALRQALRAGGIECVVIKQSELELPRRLTLKRVDISAEHLVVYDALDRPQPKAWDEVVVVAVGDLQFTERERKVTSIKKRSHVRMDVSYGTRQGQRLTMALVLKNGEYHYAQADTFLYHGLGDRQTNDRGANFMFVIWQVLSHAHHALPNRGVLAMQPADTGLLGYPSVQAFEREIAWLWWYGRSVR